MSFTVSHDRAPVLILAPVLPPVLAPLLALVRMLMLAAVLAPMLAPVLVLVLALRSFGPWLRNALIKTLDISGRDEGF